MSNDEFIVLLASLAFGPVAWAVLFFRLAGVEKFGGRRAHLLVLAGAVGACTLVLTVILLRYSAPDVRHAPQYLLLYLLLGLAWLRVSELCFAYTGLSLRDDVIERSNVAALTAASGALIGVTLCYAGGNIGSGPGWWVVVFSGALATISLGAIWLLLDEATGLHDLVTIDRDPAAGVRVGGLLAASGLILGRAVAGDWHSIQATLEDFARVGWVVLPVAGTALLVERVAKPTVGRPRPSVVAAGALPALIYLLFATAYILTLGWPP